MEYEAVPYEAAKALRALASLAYSEPVEVVGKLSRGFPEQILQCRSMMRFLIASSQAFLLMSSSLFWGPFEP